MNRQVVFDHRGRTKAGCEGPLEVRVTHEGKPYYINTDIHVRGSEFCFGEIVNRNDKRALNERLHIMVDKIDRAVTRCIENNERINVANIKKRMSDIDREENPQDKSFLDWMYNQIDMLNVSEGTRKHYLVLYRRLDAFGKVRRWEDLKPERIYEFDAWLHRLSRPSTIGEKQQGKSVQYISDVAVYGYHKNFKALLRRAVRIGALAANPYDKLKGEFKRKDKESTEYLSDEEMEALESLHPVPGTLMALCRDLFVFQMYTGLSYSDSQVFDIGDYRNVDGKWVNVGERVKTGVPYVSQLLPPVVEVLERYDWNAPKVSMQVYNDRLKDIGKVLGFKQPLHSHLARHTFATWALRNGVPIEYVSKMLGHTNIKQTQRYAKVLPTEVFNQFDKLAKKLNK
jgi:integrase